MTRRSPLAVTLVALLAVSGSIVTTAPRGVALAADPEAQLADTQAQLADANATRRSLAVSLDEQRAKLAQLQEESAQLSDALDIAVAELNAVTAEYYYVVGLLDQVRIEVEAVKTHLADLRAQIAVLDDEMNAVAVEILERTRELEAREALLEDHLRDAYAQSQTSMLEILLSSESLDTAGIQVGYLLTVSEQDRVLAELIAATREELDLRRDTLKEGRLALADARAVARDEEAMLETRQSELEGLEIQVAELKLLAEQKEVEQETALNASVQAEGNVEAQIAEIERAAQAQEELVDQLESQAAAYQAQIEEARRLAEEARRRAEEEARRAAEDAARRSLPPPRAPISSFGFVWPEASFVVTQEWGPTSFVLEPPYTYHGTYYPNFHGGIDIANSCGTPILATGPGVVVASGQPLAPFDSGFGVVVEHGSGIQSWYWHLTTQIVVRPGQIVIPGTVIGYEGSTGWSTGCHLHFAINDGGTWENPRAYLP